MPSFVRVLLWPLETSEAALLWGITSTDDAKPAA